MSERGSFATELTWCITCHQAVGTVLGDLLLQAAASVREIVFWDNETGAFQQGLWAGRVRGLYAGEELDVFTSEVNPALAAVLCHPLRLAVFADSGASQVFVVDREDRPEVS